MRQVLRRGGGTEPETLDPGRAESLPASNILRDLYEGLTSEAPDGTVIPGAADRWTTSADGLTWTFHVREDARWSDGTPVTAADFEYGLRRAVDPATLSRYSSILFPIWNAEEIVAGRLPPESLGVRALGPHELEIRLRHPTPYFLGLLAHNVTYPVQRRMVERWGRAFGRPGRLVGNGAYRLEEWVVQSHIRLVRNPYYRDDAHTRIDEVWIFPTENADAELKRYRAGEVDITETLPARQLGWIREHLGDQLRIAPYLGSYYFNYNVTRPPFRDSPQLRLALSLAIDRDVLTQRITRAGEVPAWGWVPPVAHYRPQAPPWAGWTQAQRNAEARRLYAEAGYSAEHPLRTEILYNTDQNHQRIAAAMAAMWKEVLGVECTLSNQEWKVFLQTRHQKVTTQVVRGAWIGDYNDAYTFAQLMHSRNLENDPGYANPRYDALVDQAAVEGDLDRRARLLEQAEQVLLADMPIIPLYIYVSKHLVSPRVGGFRDNILDHHRTQDLWIRAPREPAT